jgi:hypothetical protein
MAGEFQTLCYLRRHISATLASPHRPSPAVVPDITHASEQAMGLVCSMPRVRGVTLENAHEGARAHTHTHTHTQVVHPVVPGAFPIQYECIYAASYAMQNSTSKLLQNPGVRSERRPSLSTSCLEWDGGSSNQQYHDGRLEWDGRLSRH